MKLTKWMAAGTAAASLGVGGLVGAVVLTPAVSSAQSDDGPTETSAEDPTPRLGGHRGMDIAPLADVAETIGISADELRAALSEGQTIAQVAEANDVDPQTVVDALVTSSTDHLEARIAGLPERMEGLVNDAFDGHGLGGDDRRGHRGPDRAPDADDDATEEPSDAVTAPAAAVLSIGVPRYSAPLTPAS